MSKSQSRRPRHKLRATRKRCIGTNEDNSCTMNKTRKHSIPCPNCDGYALDPNYKPNSRKEQEPRKIKWIKKGMIKVAVYDD